MNFSLWAIFAVVCLSQVTNAQVVVPLPNAPISADRIKASVIYSRVTGVKTGIDAPILQQMEERIAANDLVGAAALATNDPNFYEITIRQLASPMSNRDETIKVPLNDFTATFIGVVRDDLDARDLLRGNFYYAGRPADVTANQNLLNDIIKSNNHYVAVDASPRPLSQVLERRNQQQLLNSGNAAANNPDAAGLITSRAFTEAHAVAGTNRRMVQMSFKQFLCIDIAQWATLDSPDNMVGPDVERGPDFQGKCKGCHGNMDGLRGAFANLDFEDNVLKNSLVMTQRTGGDGNADPNQTTFAEARFQNVTYAGVSQKYVRNAGTFLGGKFTRDAAWINTATKGGNAEYFGWRTPKDENGNINGYGLKQFGSMLSESQAFSRCMVKRVFKQVCKREVSPLETDLVRNLASSLEQDSYNLKRLVQRVATNSACIGN